MDQQTQESRACGEILLLSVALSSRFSGRTKPGQLTALGRTACVDGNFKARRIQFPPDKGIPGD
jgi:hypothetical protein